MFHISEEYFHQGLRQAAFFHGIPAKDARYDIEKDVVEGKLVSVGGGADEEMKEAGGEGESDTPYNKPKPSFEEIIEPL